MSGTGRLEEDWYLVEERALLSEMRCQLWGSERASEHGRCSARFGREARAGDDRGDMLGLRPQRARSTALQVRPQSRRYRSAAARCTTGRPLPDLCGWATRNMWASWWSQTRVRVVVVVMLAAALALLVGSAGPVIEVADASSAPREHSSRAAPPDGPPSHLPEIASAWSKWL